MVDFLCSEVLFLLRSCTKIRTALTDLQGVLRGPNCSKFISQSAIGFRIEYICEPAWSYSVGKNLPQVRMYGSFEEIDSMKSCRHYHSQFLAWCSPLQRWQAMITTSFTLNSTQKPNIFQGRSGIVRRDAELGADGSWVDPTGCFPDRKGAVLHCLLPSTWCRCYRGPYSYASLLLSWHHTKVGSHHKWTVHDQPVQRYAC